MLLQVVLHSQIAKDDGDFDIEDVAKVIETWTKIPASKKFLRIPMFRVSMTRING